MALSAEKVRRLIGLMNEVSETKIPAMKPVVECFELAMGEKTLDYLLEVGTGEHTLSQLQEIYIHAFSKKDYDSHWEEVWSEIMTMSFLIPGEQDHSKYLLAPIFPGWIELSTSGPVNEKNKAILNKWTEFWRLLKLINIAPVRYYMNRQAEKEEKEKPARFSTYLSQGTRTIHLDEPLTSEQQVRPAGDVYQLLKNHKDEIAIMNCICRLHKEMEGKECDFDLPLEGCMNVGPLSKQLVENGISRKLSYEEACDLLEQFAKKGAIHTIYHYQNDANREEFNICNCCNDCCLLYSSPLDGYLSKVFVRSFYAPEMIDESRCVGCNLCGRSCATGATYYDKKAKKLMFDYDNCIGCGQCVLQCHFDVRRMVKDERSVYVKSGMKRHA